MHNGDVLGDEGRKALNACVKVKIFGKPETRRYDRKAALERLEGCYAHWYGLFGTHVYSWYDRRRDFHQLLLPTTCKENGNAVTTKTYNIVDIHDALVNFDERRLVDKYSKERPGSDELRDLIDKRREDVERELEEATADPEGRRRYSWLVAQRRVRDCFAGLFPEDRWTLSDEVVREKRQGWDYQYEEWNQVNESYNITDIHDAVLHWDEVRERAETQRSALEKECAEASAATQCATADTPQKYTRHQAEERVKNCLPIGPTDRIPVKMMDKNKMLAINQSNNIFDICKAVIQFDVEKYLKKYPDEGPGSDELKKVIDENRANLKEDYQKATCDTDSKPILHEYSWKEAEHRVRNCFAGTFLGDTEIFPNTNKNEQSYDIFDIKQAVKYFDTKTFCDACKYKSEGTPQYGESKQKVDEQRASIQQEYELATTNVEIEHGSGFIVNDHFIITNRHVIETYLNETEGHEIYISNEAIGELACKVIRYDAGKDLALLCCPDLNLEQSGICPLKLSHQALLPGMSIFSFGYPMSHTGETALFVSGNVSGSKKTLAGHSMAVLNCALNSGNSGGPVLCWVKGQLRVVGVATQKHFKEILSFEERETIEHIREALQTHAIPDVPEYVVKSRSFTDHYSFYLHHQTPMFLLTLKLYDALETHSQFNLSNALPGHLVADFIKDSVSKYTGEYKEELAAVIELSKDCVNILPSGHVSASQCCIQ
ncbi:uncharacterized protein LOC144638565 [Oculina patagonica]